MGTLFLQEHFILRVINKHFLITHSIISLNIQTKFSSGNYFYCTLANGATSQIVSAMLISGGCRGEHVQDSAHKGVVGAMWCFICNIVFILLLMIYPLQFKFYFSLFIKEIMQRNRKHEVWDSGYSLLLAESCLWRQEHEKLQSDTSLA